MSLDIGLVNRDHVDLDVGMLAQQSSQSVTEYDALGMISVGRFFLGFPFIGFVKASEDVARAPAVRFGKYQARKGQITTGSPLPERFGKIPPEIAAFVYEDLQRRLYVAEKVLLARLSPAMLTACL